MRPVVLDLYEWAVRNEVPLGVGSCPPPATVWNAYAGGFYLRTPSACVPLVFRVGKRSATVWFGLGQACAH